jgi:hypothetical protein
MDCRSVDDVIEAAKAGHRHLQLWDPPVLTDDDVQRLARATHEIPTLTHLGFFRCGLSHQQLALLCKGLSSNLRHLLLQFCNIGDHGLFWIAQLLQRNDSCLERLFVCDDIVGDKGIGMIAQALEGNTVLKFLCVTDNMFTDDAVRNLLHLMTKNITIKTLHFSGQNNAILDKSLVNQLSTVSKYPEMRADWQRIEAVCGLTMNRLSKRSAFRGIPVELIRMVKDMLCEQVAPVMIES